MPSEVAFSTNPNLLVFFLTATANAEIYTLSLHDALPIWRLGGHGRAERPSLPADLRPRLRPRPGPQRLHRNRKSTRLNSSHSSISYAVFCLKKKKNNQPHNQSHQHYHLQ